MPRPLRVLLVDDSEDDALLVLAALQRGAYEPVYEIVQTREAMQAALDRRPEWDLVISDYTMPHFSGPGALALLQQSGHDIPFIVVSGAVGEEAAVGLLKAGAHDFMLKRSLARLVPAVERELRDAAGRRERLEIEAEVHRLNAELERRVEARTRELAALYDVSAIAGQPLDLPDMLERSLARVLEASECPAGAVYLPDKETAALRVVAQHGPDAEALSAAMAAMPDVWAQVAAGIALLAVLVQPNGERSERPAIGMALRVGAQVAGVLGLFGKEAEAFTREERAMLTAAADQMGLMVENARLHQEAAQAAVSEERQRLAGELHDSVTQLLYGLTLQAQAARQALEAGNVERAGVYLSQAGDAARQALKEMRLLVHELRPSVLKEAGLIGALRRRLDAVEGRSGIAARLIADSLPAFPRPIEEAFYWIAQEALNNALKHSRSAAVELHLSAGNGQASVAVTDFGVGFDPQSNPESGGLGLSNMRERARKVGGQLTIQSVIGQGTTIACTVALPVNTHRQEQIVGGD